MGPKIKSLFCFSLFLLILLCLSLDVCPVGRGFRCCQGIMLYTVSLPFLFFSSPLGHVSELISTVVLSASLFLHAKLAGGGGPMVQWMVWSALDPRQPWSFNF